MTRWYAIAYGALDLRGARQAVPDVELVVLAVIPSEPHGLAQGNADLWLDLVGDGRDDDELDDAARELVRAFAESGIASNDPQHPHRVLSIAAPWLTSPLHELVYALVAGVAADAGIDAIFVKGPVLRRQGLREREHSGDVDVWVDPQRLAAMNAALAAWGWRLQPDVWHDTEINHSVTLEPCSWGCEIDLHRHFPGIAISEEETFIALQQQTSEIRFAGALAVTLDVAAHAVVVALHAMRPRYQRTSTPEQISEAATALGTGGIAALEFALRLGAGPALKDSIVRAFPDADVDLSGTPPLNWRWRQQPNHALAYATAIRMAPVRAWPVIVFRLLWPSAAVLDASDKRVGVPTHGAVTARVKRLLRGFRRSF